MQFTVWGEEKMTKIPSKYISSFLNLACQQIIQKYDFGYCATHQQKSGVYLQMQMVMRKAM